MTNGCKTRSNKRVVAEHTSLLIEFERLSASTEHDRCAALISRVGSSLKFVKHERLRSLKLIDEVIFLNPKLIIKVKIAVKHYL